MPFINPILLVALLAAVVPTGALASVAPATGIPVRVTVTGPEMIRLTGAANGGMPALQAVLYAAFGPDLPTVFLRRQPLTTDAAGNFDATVSIAPAFFSGAIITVLVQTSAAVTVGRGSITIADPTGAAADHP
jgi:hypothetical protein